MTMDEFLEIKKPKIEDFLMLEQPELYDFTNNFVSQKNYYAYRKISNPLEKFITYMSTNRAYKRKDNSIMKKGANYSQECKKEYGVIPDPDSTSELLILIYHALWGDEHLTFCESPDLIQGDTLISGNTTIDIYYENYKESSSEKKERCALVPKQKVSIRYIISRYVEAMEQGFQLFESNIEILSFLSLYHSLGNFMPIPVHCNTPRGVGKTKDYWDLALKIIYDYYVKNIDNIVDITGNKSFLIKIYKEWLDSFVVNGNRYEGWQNFINKNYLQSFVNSNKGQHGEPKELWDGHFEEWEKNCIENACPETQENIKQFYTRASEMILARGRAMVAELKKINTSEFNK